MDSPWYLLLIVALLAVIGALWFLRGGQWGGSSTSIRRPAAREPEQASEPVLDEALTEIELPTTRPDYPMIFSARVLWQPIPQPAGAPAPCRSRGARAHAVVERAASFVGDHAPSDLHVARNALAAQLGVMRPDPTGQIRAQATNVALDLRADDADRLRGEADRRRAA